MKILLMGFVGALIGYITNWLAIKMIFRPHEPKFIGKFKIPFTPGLIPKEQSRIAKSVGGAIGSHLLTEETIQEYLCGEKVESALRKWIRDKMHELKEERTTISSLIESVIGEKSQKIKDYLKKKTKDYIQSLVLKKDTRDKITEILSSEVLKLTNVQLKTLTKSELFVKLYGYIFLKVKKAKNSEEIKSTITKAVMSFAYHDKERKLNEVLPESTQAAILQFVENNREELCEKIINGLSKETVKEKIIESIDEMVNTKLSPMIAMFLKGETVYPMIVNTLEGYLSEDENRMMLVGLINTEITNYMDNTIEDLIEKYGEEKIESIIKEGSNVLLTSFIKDETLEQLFIKFINSNQEDITLREFIEKIHSGAFDNLQEYLDKIILGLLEREEVISYIEVLFERVWEWISNIEVDEILSKNQEIKESLEGEAIRLYKGFMNNNSMKIAKAIDIPAVVEEKIQEFEMTEMEEIILEIASRELKAITWFGALLGFIMGVLSASLSSL